MNAYAIYRIRTADIVPGDRIRLATKAQGPGRIADYDRLYRTVVTNEIGRTPRGGNDRFLTFTDRTSVVLNPATKCYRLGRSAAKKEQS